MPVDPDDVSEMLAVLNTLKSSVADAWQQAFGVASKRNYAIAELEPEIIEAFAQADLAVSRWGRERQALSEADVGKVTCLLPPGRRVQDVSDQGGDKSA